MPNWICFGSCCVAEGRGFQNLWEHWILAASHIAGDGLEFRRWDHWIGWCWVFFFWTWNDHRASVSVLRHLLWGLWLLLTSIVMTFGCTGIICVMLLSWVLPEMDWKRAGGLREVVNSLLGWRWVTINSSYNHFNNLVGCVFFDFCVLCFFYGKLLVFAILFNFFFLSSFCCLEDQAEFQEGGVMIACLGSWPEPGHSNHYMQIASGWNSLFKLGIPKWKNLTRLINNLLWYL